MTEDLAAAYRLVHADLAARADNANRTTAAQRRYVQSLENARAILAREAGIGN